MSATRTIVRVDTSDRVIGAMLPHERSAETVYRCSALWLTNPRTGDVLLAQRAPHMAFGGTWGPAAAGTVEDGETYLDNATKELAEEIGVVGVPLIEGPKEYAENLGPLPHRRYFCQWFLGEVDQPAEAFTLEASEVSAVRWVHPADLRREIADHPERFIPLADRWPVLP